MQIMPPAKQSQYFQFSIIGERMDLFSDVEMLCFSFCPVTLAGEKEAISYIGLMPDARCNSPLPSGATADVAVLIIVIDCAGMDSPDTVSEKKTGVSAGIAAVITARRTVRSHLICVLSFLLEKEAVSIIYRSLFGNEGAIFRT